MLSLKHGFLVASAVSLAFVGGRLSVPDRAPVAVAKVAAEREACKTTSPGPAGLSAANVRAILREELAAASPPTEVAVDDAPPPPAEPAEAPEAPNPAAHEAAAVVEAALARGLWTAADRDQLRALLGKLGRGDAEILLGRIGPAVNSGRLMVEPMQGPMI